MSQCHRAMTQSVTTDCTPTSHTSALTRSTDNYSSYEMYKTANKATRSRSKTTHNASQLQQSDMTAFYQVTLLGEMGEHRQSTQKLSNNETVLTDTRKGQEFYNHVP